MRVGEADVLSQAGHWTAAIYLLGYAVEMCLGAAAFQAAGYDIRQEIPRDERLAKANQLKAIPGADGKRLMTTDPHDFVGWARYLEWHQSPTADAGRKVVLQEAVRRAKVVYQHWRPELRYKTTTDSERQLAVVRPESEWFLQRIDTL